MATAHSAASTLTTRTSTALLGTGFVPVAPTSTATRLADRWLFFVRAIDSSFSAAVTSPGRWDAGIRGECPLHFCSGAHRRAAGPRPSPNYVGCAGSDERQTVLLSPTLQSPRLQRV